MLHPLCNKKDFLQKHTLEAGVLDSRELKRADVEELEW